MLCIGQVHELCFSNVVVVMMTCDRRIEALEKQLRADGGEEGGDGEELSIEEGGDGGHDTLRYRTGRRKANRAGGRKVKMFAFS